MNYINKEELIKSFDKPCILIGEQKLYKTTILLHYAYIKVKEFRNFDHGIFICTQTKLDQDDRLIFGRGDYKKQINADNTNRIKLKYMESYLELCQYLQALFLSDDCPRFIFIDDLHLYVQNDFKKLGFILFLLRNVCTLIDKKYGFSSNFNIMAAWQIETEDVKIPLTNKVENTLNDINENKIKQACLLFLNNTPNLIQINKNSKNINLQKIYQDCTTLKMLKCDFINKEFKEIQSHINQLL